MILLRRLDLDLCSCAQDLMASMVFSVRSTKMVEDLWGAFKVATSVKSDEVGGFKV